MGKGTKNIEEQNGQMNRMDRMNRMDKMDKMDGWMDGWDQGFTILVGCWLFYYSK